MMRLDITNILIKNCCRKNANRRDRRTVQPFYPDVQMNSRQGRLNSSTPAADDRRQLWAANIEGRQLAESDLGAAAGLAIAVQAHEKARRLKPAGLNRVAVMPRVNGVLSI
jgi:hypothetical protein